MMKQLRLSIYSSLSLLLVSSTMLGIFQHQASAGEITFNGFITQGLTYSKDNAFYGEADKLSLDFTELGANAFWQINNRVNVFGQILSRRAGNVDNGSLKLDYLGVDFSVYQAPSQRFNLRLGRVKNLFGIYNETRDVAFTRPGTFLPQSIYLEVLRDLQISSDGFTGHWEMFHNDHRFAVEFGYGRPKADEDSEINWFTLNSENSQFEDEELAQARFWAELDNGTWVIGYSYFEGEFFIDIDSDFVTPFQDGHFYVSGGMVTLQYNLENWSFTGEYFNFNNVYDLGPASADSKQDSESYYVQAEYRLRQDLTLLARSDTIYFNKNDKDGRIYEQATGLPGFNLYSKDITVGLRWQINQNWLYMFEHHEVEGAGWLDTRDNPDRSILAKDWSLTSMSISYRF